MGDQIGVLVLNGHAHGDHVHKGEQGGALPAEECFVEVEGFTCCTR